MRRLAAVLLLGTVACTTGGSQRPSGGLVASPRLVTSYVLVTVQAAILDLEPIRDYLCDPAKNLVTHCQRAERLRGELQMVQVQLTRFLGGDPDKESGGAPTIYGWPF